MLRDVFSITPIITDGEAEKESLHGLHAPLDLYVGTLKTLVDVVPVDNEETSWMPVRLSTSTPPSLNECGSHVC